MGINPIDALVRGRDALRVQRENEREQRYRAMLVRTQADTLIALWEKLPRCERQRVTARLAGEAGGEDPVGEPET